MMYQFHVEQVTDESNGARVSGIWVGDLLHIGDQVTLIQRGRAPFRAVISDLTRGDKERVEGSSMKLRGVSAGELSRGDLFLHLGALSGFVQDASGVRSRFGEPSVLRDQIARKVDNYVIYEDVQCISDIVFLLTESDSTKTPTCVSVSDHIVWIKAPREGRGSLSETLNALSAPLHLLYDELDPDYDDDHYGLQADLLVI